MTNVSEVIDFSDKPAKPRASQTGKYQYFIEGNDPKNNIKISARSAQFPIDTPRSILINQAFENFYERYAQSRGADYDADIGKKLFEDANASITRQGFVYYTKLTQF